jgi:hypothetical protein
MLRILVVGLSILLGTTAIAETDCSFFCYEPVRMTDDQARETLNFIFGAPLPDGLKISGMVDTCYRDNCYKARLTGDARSVAALLALGRATMSDLVVDPHKRFAPYEQPWWDVATVPNLPTVDLFSATIPYTYAAVTPDPDTQDQFIIYLIAARP